MKYVGCQGELPPQALAKKNKCCNDVCARLALRKSAPKRLGLAHACLPKSEEVWIEDYIPFPRRLRYGK